MIRKKKISFEDLNPEQFEEFKSIHLLNRPGFQAEYTKQMKIFKSRHNL